MTQAVNVPGVGTLNFPDGMSQDDMATAIQKNFPQIHPPGVTASTSPTVAPQAADGQRNLSNLIAGTQAAPAPIGVLGRIAQGIRDPIDAGAQMLSHTIGQTNIGKFIDQLGQKVGMAPGDPQSIDSGIQTREAQYQAGRNAAGSTGFDPARLVGNIATLAPLAAAAPTLPTLAGRMALGAGTGLVAGSMQPVTQGDFASQKAKQAGIGAVTGGLLPAVTGTIARAIQPNVNPAVQSLMDAGVTPTPGQVMGGIAKATEEKATSVPILGSAITAGMNRANQQFNTAAINRALAPIGDAVPPGVTGNDAIAYTRQALGNAYDTVLNKIGAVKADPQLGQDIQNVSGMLANQPKDIQGRLNDIVQNEITSRLNPQGYMTSDAMKAAQANIGKLAAGYKTDPTTDVRTLGNALSEVNNSLRNWLVRQAPAEADQLSNIDQGYANFKRVQRAAGSVGAQDGVFTPAQLQNAVKVGDYTKDKRAFSEGDALMQDLSAAGKSVMGNKIPDSGTAGRTALLGSVFAPIETAAAAIPSLAYLPSSQRALAYLMTQRPDIAPKLADMVRQGSPMLTPGLAQLLSAQRQQ